MILFLMLPLEDGGIMDATKFLLMVSITMV